MATEPATTPDDAKPQGRGGLIEALSLKARFVLVFGEINDTVARATCRRLLALAAESSAP